jgi:hypothetical protein
MFRKEYAHCFGGQTVVFAEVGAHSDLAGFDLRILVDPKTLSRNGRARREQNAHGCQYECVVINAAQVRRIHL